MAKASCKVPYDFWGLSIEQIKGVIKGTGARLTNEEYEHDGMTGRFKLKDVGRYRIVASSRKKLDRALFFIREAARKQEQTPEEAHRISVESLRRKHSRPSFT